MNTDKYFLSAEYYDSLPENVKSILDQYNEEGDLYKECSRIVSLLNEIGWDGEYGLDGDICAVWPIETDPAD